VALGIVGASVWAATLRRDVARMVVALTLASGAFLSAEWSFPHYISYVPIWAGGVKDGYRWLSDSNYDWGQDIDVLERNWGALTAAGGGKAPDLVYFGFVDPRVTHGLSVGPRSWCGFMQRAAVNAEGEESLQRWLDGLRPREGTLVASLSSLQLVPEEAGLSGLEAKDYIGRIGNAFVVYRLPPREAR
jgi:hypothetical protein